MDKSKNRMTCKKYSIFNILETDCIARQKAAYARRPKSGRKPAYDTGCQNCEQGLTVALSHGVDYKNQQKNQAKLKTCTRCKSLGRPYRHPRTTEFFPPNLRYRDHLDSYCRRCKNEVSKKATQKKRMIGIYSR